MPNLYYFPRYSQKENFITNNTLLLFYRLYNESRLKFQNFLREILHESTDSAIDDVQKIGLQIEMQSPTEESILDGHLRQFPFQIGIETKRSSNDFYSDQLERHLSKFGKGTSGFQLLLSPSPIKLEHSKWDKLKMLANSKNVALVPITFERIIECFRACLKDHDDELHALIDDFEDFCSGEQLLDQDRLSIFAPPCGKSFNINIEYMLYFCHLNWSRRNTKYLGIYKDRAIRYIGEIKNIVHVDMKESGDVDFQNQSDTSALVDQSIKDRILKAAEAAKALNDWGILHKHKFYLCDRLLCTNFMKSTPNGIMGHRYFNVRDYLRDYSSLEKIAEGLNGLTWESTLNQK